MRKHSKERPFDCWLWLCSAATGLISIHVTCKKQWNQEFTQGLCFGSKQNSAFIYLLAFNKFTSRTKDNFLNADQLPHVYVDTAEKLATWNSWFFIEKRPQPKIWCKNFQCRLFSKLHKIQSLGGTSERCVVYFLKLYAQLQHLTTIRSSHVQGTGDHVSYRRY